MGARPVHKEIGEFVIAAHGIEARVRELLAARPELVDLRYQKLDETALAATAHMGRVPIAEALLAAGAPLTICAAVMLGRGEAVAAFPRDDPALANARGAHGIPIPFHAALSGDVAIAAALVAHGGGQGASPAPRGAVRPGHLAMARWLLDRGADPSAPNFEGKTPLRVALDQGHPESAALLRERGGREE